METMKRVPHKRMEKVRMNELFIKCIKCGQLIASGVRTVPNEWCKGPKARAQMNG